MTKRKSAPGIPDYIRGIVILSTILITISVGVLVIVQQFRLYHRVSVQIRGEVVAKHKQFIKDLIAIETEYVANQKEEFDNQIRKKLEENVNSAISLADALFRKYQHEMSGKAMEEMIVEAVASLPGFSPYAHVFINDLNGVGVFYRENSGFKGKNLWDLTDRHGNKVVQRELELIKRNGDGFLNYSGVEDTLSNKICFVKSFPQLGWYFGAKCYIDDYYDEFKLEIARKISSERFRYGGYFFMNSLDGTPIVLDGQVYEGNFNFLDGTDESKLEVFRQQVNAAMSSPEGGYFTYRWPQIGSSALSNKISYANFFAPCNWIIGAGFYVDEIEKELAAQNAELKSGLWWNIVQIILILILAVIVELFLLYRFNRYFQMDFKRFNHFFRIGKGNYRKIEIERIHFREFKNMAHIANEMIEERARVHEQLVEEQIKAQESDRLKTAFLANMSHEIRTPMNAILGFSELLFDDEIDLSVRQDFVRLVRQNGEMLMALINDIIDIAKIESGQMSITKNWFDVCSLLEGLQRHYNGVIENAKEKQILFEMKDNLPEECWVYSDEFRLKQILFNLIGNAIKFTSNGYVRVVVDRRDEHLYFSVLDTGIGISRADLHSIFDRFMQAGNHRNKNFGGTGLGLAISKNIVSLLDGRIWVKSKEGEGSEFSFYIPIGQEEPAYALIGK